MSDPLETAVHLQNLLGDRSQAWLAQESGLSRAFVSRLLSGKRKLSPAAAQALSAVLGPIDGVEPAAGVVRARAAEKRVAELEREVARLSRRLAESEARARRAAELLLEG